MAELPGGCDELLLTCWAFIRTALRHIGSITVDSLQEFREGCDTEMCDALRECCTVCYSTGVIPFRVEFRLGGPLYEQVVFAATRAMISGQIRRGDPFPSVRTLSKELKINPNTAHKVISTLVNTGLLEIRPGVGSVVAAHPESSKRERARLLKEEVEQLVVEAKRLGIELGDVLTAVSEHWEKLSAERRKRLSDS